MATLGDRVKERRGQLELSQEAAAAKGGMSLRTLQRIEKDQHWPTRRTIHELAKALDCKVSDLSHDVADVCHSCEERPATLGGVLCDPCREESEKKAS